MLSVCECKVCMCVGSNKDNMRACFTLNGGLCFKNEEDDGGNDHEGHKQGYGLGK